MLAAVRDPTMRRLNTLDTKAANPFQASDPHQSSDQAAGHRVALPAQPLMHFPAGSVAGYGRIRRSGAEVGR